MADSSGNEGGVSSSGKMDQISQLPRTLGIPQVRREPSLEILEARFLFRAEELVRSIKNRRSYGTWRVQLEKTGLALRRIQLAVTVSDLTSKDEALIAKFDSEIEEGDFTLPETIGVQDNGTENSEVAGEEEGPEGDSN